MLFHAGKFDIFRFLQENITLRLTDILTCSIAKNGSECIKALKKNFIATSNLIKKNLNVLLGRDNGSLNLRTILQDPMQ